MAAEREVRVKLVADVEDYIAAMERARKATRWANQSRILERLAFFLGGVGVTMITTGLLMAEVGS